MEGDPLPLPPAKKQKTAHTMIDIVDNPTGDLVIRAGKGADAGLVRVHKNFLVIASPVFRAMLMGGFSESARALDENDPLELGDDDYGAFVIFCKLIHYQDIDHALTMECLAEVAVVTDKYACTGSLLQPLLPPWGRFVASPNPEEDPSETDLLNLVLIAYIAKNSDLLWLSSRYVAVNFPAATMRSHLDTSLGRVAPDVIGKSSSACDTGASQLTLYRRND